MVEHGKNYKGWLRKNKKIINDWGYTAYIVFIIFAVVFVVVRSIFPEFKLSDLYYLNIPLSLEKSPVLAISSFVFISVVYLLYFLDNNGDDSPWFKEVASSDDIESEFSSAKWVWVKKQFFIIENEIREEISRTTKRNNLSLVIGVMTTLLAISILGSTLASDKDFKVQPITMFLACC